MENLIIPKDKLPWYKDADATRIAVGVGYLVVLVSIMVFVMLTQRDVPSEFLFAVDYRFESGKNGAPVYFKRVNGEFVAKSYSYKPKQFSDYNLKVSNKE